MKEWICKHHFVKQIFTLVLAALLVVQSSGMTVLADDVQNDAESIQEEVSLNESEIESLEEQEPGEQDSPESGTATYMLQYQAHCQTIGWQDWKESGEMAGTAGQSKRM